MAYVLSVFICFVLFWSRHVILPSDLSRLVPKSHLMTETEWRNLGVNRALAGYIICCMHPNHMYCYSVGHYHQRLPRHHPHQRRLCNSCHSCRSFCGFGPNADFGQTPNDIDVIEAIPFFVCCNTMTIHNTDTHTFIFFY